MLALIAPNPARAGAACVPATHDATGVPVAIPSPPGVAESPLVVPEEGEANGVDVRIEISHPFDSDLRLELVPPAGDPVLLAEGVGTWGDDFANTTFDDGAESSIVSELPPFAGSFRPQEPLSDLAGIQRSGTWKLRVTDRHTGYEGTIESWGLEISCPDIEPPTGQEVSTPRKLFQRDTDFAVSWAAGADASGIAAREVAYWQATTEAGFGEREELSAGPATEATFTGAEPGSTYCFSERLRDGAGNRSDWSAQRCAAIPLDDPALTPSAGWTSKERDGFYGGDALKAKARGETLTTEEVSGDQFALVATKCRRCGRVKAFLDGVLMEKVSLRSRRTRRSRVIALEQFAELKQGEVEIKVVSSDRKVLVEGLGVARSPIEVLPEVWEEAGAPEPPPLPSGVPAGAEEIIGTLLTVTTTSDAADGDTSSVANLEASPGADGEISLREAIEATNSDPGPETIHFDPGLTDATIAVEAPLPGLEDDGGLLINGDIDDDGDPDVTITDGANNLFGLVSISSGNRLHALAFEGFMNAAVVLLHNGPAGEALARNTLSGLTIEAEQIAIVQGVGQGGTSESDSRWLDTRIVGNRIDAEIGGIDVRVHDVTGHTTGRATIAGNEIGVDEDGTDPSGGFAIGVSVDTVDNRITEALLAHNAIRGTPEGGFFLSSAGAEGLAGAGPVIEDVRVLGNHLQLDPAQHATTGFGTSGIGIFAGDSFDPTVNSVTRGIQVRDNLVEGYGRQGIGVVAGCCGATNGVVEDVRITQNVVGGVLLPRFQGGPHQLFFRGIAISGGADADNEARNVTVARNTVSIDNDPDDVIGAELLAGGLVVEGVGPGPGNRATDVTIAKNLVDTELIGLSVIGGLAQPGSPNEDNHVFGVEASRNLILREPLLVHPAAPGVRAVSLIGGSGPLTPAGGVWSATANSVSCIALEENIVVGILDDHFLADNLGSGAAGNTASLSGCAQ